MDLFEQPLPKKVLPLAERMRPRALHEVWGQDHLIGPGRPLTQLESAPTSLILWGPPGVGKTTIARLLAGQRRFFSLSAVLDGLTELRKVIEALKLSEERAVLFVDEIHRWNKAQQDSLLPYLENGTFSLIGATTENPSFSLISPLLSRAKVFVLKPLENATLEKLLALAINDRERGLGAKFITIDDEARNALVADSGGDARKMLHSLEIAASLSHKITLDTVRSVLQKKSLPHDRNGDAHYDLLSAFIKSMRGSDVDASLYYLARLLEVGEDARTIARRMIIFASEDIGLADPRALPMALAAADAFDRVGDAEGWIPLAHVVSYLALAPKSNTSYVAYKMVRQRIDDTGALPVPLHLRNAPTALAKSLGHAEGYQYAHDVERVTHAYLPLELQGERFFFLGKNGFEKLLANKGKSE